MSGMVQGEDISKKSFLSAASTPKFWMMYRKSGFVSAQIIQLLGCSAYSLCDGLYKLIVDSVSSTGILRSMMRQRV